MEQEDHEGLYDLNQRFVWTADGKVDTWRILSEPQGALRGDCDDYAVTVGWILAGKSMSRFWMDVVTLKAVYWFVKSDKNNVGHLVLKYRGLGYIDNIYPYWRPETSHRKKFPMVLPLVVLKMALGKVGRLFGR